MLVVVVFLGLAACSSHRPALLAGPFPVPVATGDYPAHGHAADFSWIAGQVERDLSCIYLDFGDRRRTPWGGRIALDATGEQMSVLRSGDMVVIKGELTRLAYGSCGSPSFVVSTIEEH